MTNSTGHGYRCNKGQMEQGEGERRWKVASSWDKKEKKQGLRWRGKKDCHISLVARLRKALMVQLLNYLQCI